VWHKHIFFEITDPSGNITEYNTAWALSAPQAQGGVFSIARINVTIHGGGIEVGQYPFFIGGKALLSGTYKVEVIKDFYPLQDYDTPPHYLGLQKIETITYYPFTYLLPVGVSISIVGIVVSVKAAKSKKKRKIRKT
jgi:hypothetical protein